MDESERNAAVPFQNVLRALQVKRGRSEGCRHHFSSVWFTQICDYRLAIVLQRALEIEPQSASHRANLLDLHKKDIRQAISTSQALRTALSEVLGL